MSNKVWVWLLCCWALLWLPASAADWQTIRERGELWVLTTGDYPPYTVAQTTGPFCSLAQPCFSGSDINLIKAFAAAHRLRIRFFTTSWPLLLSDFKTRPYDVAVGGITATPDRAQQVDFTQPLSRDGKVAVAHCDKLEQLDTLEELNLFSVWVISNPGGTNETFVRTQLPRASLKLYPDNLTIFDALLAGQADVMITDGVEARLQSQQHPELCASPIPFEGTTQPKAWMVQKQTTLLQRHLTDWLEQHLPNPPPGCNFE